MDSMELTKSERERAAEMLFVWRNQLGWSALGKTRGTSKAKACAFLCFAFVTSVLVVAALTLRA